MSHFRSIHTGMRINSDSKQLLSEETTMRRTSDDLPTAPGRVVVEGPFPLSPSTKCSDARTSFSDQSSLLSLEVYEEEEIDEDSSSSLSNESSTFEAKWERLEHHFAARDKMLQKISQGRNPSFLKMLREREEAVRTEARQFLLMSCTDRDSPQRSKVPNVSNSILEKHSTSFFQMVHDTISFELFSTVPSIFSMVLHSLAHVGFYEVFNSIIEEFEWKMGRQKYLLLDDIVLIVIGSILVRASGYLYWWLSDKDYLCLRFDYHNRLRLGMWDARFMQWVRERNILRVFIYHAGYYISYVAILHMYWRIVKLFNQKERLLANLPSRHYDVGLCYSDNMSFCAFSCNAAMERRAEEQAALEAADWEYTTKALAAHSFDTYWAASGVSEWPLFSTWGYIGVSAMITATSLLLLAAYGFEFWVKY